MTEYIYLGDKLTRPELKGQNCIAIKKINGKCIRSRMSTMLVDFDGERHIILARRLRKIKIIG